jgi:hypothetical protein
MIRRTFVALTLQTLLIGAVVFLPMFLVGVQMTLVYRGFPFAASGLLYEVGGAIVTYVGISPPVGTGLLIYAGALGLLRRRPHRVFQAGTVALAPLVPLTPIALRVPGEVMLRDYSAATAIATGIFALAVAGISGILFGENRSAAAVVVTKRPEG